MGSRLPLTFPEVAKYAVGAGWKGWQVVTATAIAKAESGHDGYAVGVIGTAKRTKPDGTEEPNPAFLSLDVGLWQINTHWNPGVTVADMLDPGKNAGHAFGLWASAFDRATGSYAAKVHAAWSPWNAYLAGTHEQFLPLAVDAALEVGASR